MLAPEIVEEIKKLTPKKREDLMWRLTQKRFGEVLGEDKMNQIYREAVREVAEERQDEIYKLIEKEHAELEEFNRLQRLLANTLLKQIKEHKLTEKAILELNNPGKCHMMLECRDCHYREIFESYEKMPDYFTCPLCSNESCDVTRLIV